MDHVIYNLTSNRDEFHCGGYKFSRDADYDSATEKLFRRETATHRLSVGPAGLWESRWHVAQPERPGLVIPTYTARWIKSAVEPEALIHRPGTPRIFDILLLWSLWGGEFASTGTQAPFETATFYGDALFQVKDDLAAAVDRVVTTLDASSVEDIGLYPAAFLLIESFRTKVADYRTLFLSPALDSLASREKRPERSAVDEERLTALRHDLMTVLEVKRPQDQSTDPLWRNVIEPFMGTISGIGRLAAADQLLLFLQKSVAIQPLSLSTKTLESHARAFNKFRNATLHYVGLPDRVQILFGSGHSVLIKATADREQMSRALIYYTLIFRDLLVLHFSRRLSINSPWGELRLETTLRQFFEDGLSNGHDWVHEAFMDNVDENGG